MLLHILVIPVFFLCFVLLYQSEWMYDFLSMGLGSDRLVLNVLMLMCILLGVLCASRIPMTACRRYIHMSWLPYTLWTLAEQVVFACFAALYMALMYGDYGYFPALGMCMMLAIATIAYPYVIINAIVCAVYPGDPAPERELLSAMSEGAVYNLSAFRMCAHNGTHIDAPLHFIPDGKSVDQVALERFIGYYEGDVRAGDALRILADAQRLDRRAAARILIKGRAVLTAEAARVLAGGGVLLFGNESQTVGPEDAPMEVHRILLGAQVVLLEGIRLAGVEEGVYLLHAAPLNLGGAEGAPCRATLLKL